jgi:DNA-binding beta-propeller fold protein YncE
VGVAPHDAFYMGLALAVTATGPQLYAADFKNNRVEVYNAQWALVNDDRFKDPTLPAGYAPYGIQTIGSRIFVTYALKAAVGNRELPGAGRGYVSVFDFAGNFLARVASGGVLNAPWGTALANPNFGAYGGDLLIGNFGDGRINAFHENADGSWTPSGTLRGLDGAPLFIGGLWAIQFGSGAANNGQRNHLYFTAGPNGETAGVFGRILPNPSEAGGTVPATLSLSLAGPASFGAFVPGVARDYTASTTATVTSSAGDAALSFSDPGRLMNGTFALTQPLQVTLSKAAWTGPTSNEAVTIDFKQSILANEPLRTGSYSKTLTFTLSTTNP